ncbi:hypothetical protein MKW92_000031, partial [Papaver armeniacum]
SGKYMGLQTKEKGLAPVRLTKQEVMAKTSHVHYVPGKLSKDGKKRKRDFYEVDCDDIDSPTKA